MALEWLGYLELIDTFTFREKAGITIPKRVRERAFSLQLDIEIVSTDGNDYVNTKSAPAYGFYGYAVLVFRDFAEIQIPIAQPRQRLYYGSSPDAYSNWYSLFLAQASREYTKGLAVLLGQFGTALGLGEFTVPSVPCIPWSGFEEVPLREVYIKAREGTQFKLEISRWQAITRAGDTDCDYDAISNQADGDKDDGLPENGSQPQKARDRNNPYSGLPSASTPFELGDFSNSKIANVDDANPENEPEDPEEPPEGTIYWMKSVSRIKRSAFEGGCSVVRVGTAHLQLLNADIEFEQRPKESFPPTPTGCGDTTSRLQQIRLTGGEWFDWDFADSDSPLVLTKESGLVLPADSVVFE
jgi:hypothetical protein